MVFLFNFQTQKNDKIITQLNLRKFFCHIAPVHHSWFEWSTFFCPCQVIFIYWIEGTYEARNTTWWKSEHRFKSDIGKFDEMKKLHIDIDCSEHVFTPLSKHFWQQLHHWVIWVWRNKLCTPGIRGLLSFFFLDLCQVGWRALVTILVSLQKCSIGSKSGVLLRHSRTFRVVPMPLLHCLDFVLRVIGLLQSVPSAQSEVLSPMNWDFKQSKKYFQIMIPPPPCITVGLVVCRWWVMPRFLQTHYWELRPNCFSPSECLLGTFMKCQSRLSCVFLRRGLPLATLP